MIPHLCSLVGVATLSPASIARVSDALPLLGTGSVGIAGSSSSSFRHCSFFFVCGFRLSSFSFFSSCFFFFFPFLCRLCSCGSFFSFVVWFALVVVSSFGSFVVCSWFGSYCGRVVSVASSLFAMLSIHSSSVAAHPLCLPMSSAPWMVVSSGSSSSSVVWLLPSVVSSVTVVAHVLFAPSQSFPPPWCASVPSVSSSAPLLPPSSSLAFQSSTSFSHALPSFSSATAVSLPSSDASSGVGFSSTVGGSCASSAFASGNLDPELADSACVFADPLEFCDGDESASKAKDADALEKSDSHIAFKEIFSLITSFFSLAKSAGSEKADPSLWFSGFGSGRRLDPWVYLSFFDKLAPINPQVPDGVYEPPLVYCRIEFINTSPISRVAFEQKRGKRV